MVIQSSTGTFRFWCNYRLENCEVCPNSEKAKYTCPKCEVRTCSLPCANLHKKALECDGQRDKTKFLPINKFSDLDLLNGKYSNYCIYLW